jgi:hypothetical protein
MDKKIAGLLGAVAALSTLGTAQAAPTVDPSEVLRANSFAELLEPIPNAVALLKAVDEQRSATPEANEQVAQVVVVRRHHHHHHHHHAYRRRYHHHHHHHHY